MKPLLVSSGEPAGVGPELCIALSKHALPIVVLADLEMLEERANRINQNVKLIEFNPDSPCDFRPNQLIVMHAPCPIKAQPGVLDPKIGLYVHNLLEQAALHCKIGQFSGLVTAPVHKGNINSAGIPFTGHTEFLADYFSVAQVVMMLACEQMRVALVTTHLPLSQVTKAINSKLIVDVVSQVHHSLIKDFAVLSPVIKVAGLNPHAGEGGYLGREEIEIIMPALNELHSMDINAQGPFSADTLFVSGNSICDAYVTMYHDQGLPVLKYVGFNQSVNVTLGLPIVRTSVDHGTALDIAGTGKVDAGSMLAAVRVAKEIAEYRAKNESH